MAKKFRDPKKKQRYNGELNESLKSIFSINHITPLTDNQKRVFDNFFRKHLCLHGVAGTGKTFISFYLALREIIYNPDGQFKKLVVLRSIVSSRDVGFLPGNIREKTRIYEAPYYAICNELFNDPRAYDMLKARGIIEFMSTSYVRGITLNDCVVLVDEMQNQTHQELNSVITRVGKNCKIIFSGDIKQNDLVNHREYSGLSDFLKIIKTMSEFVLVEFGIEDIMRSDLVKSYLIARDNLERDGIIKPL